MSFVVRLLIAFCYFFSPVAATAQTQSQPLQVLVIERPPFVMRDEAGELTGFSIDLWREIAGRLGRDYELVVTSKFAEMLDQIASAPSGAGSAPDLAIANISITAEREARFDFSQPIFDSGLQILARADGGSLSVVKAVWNSPAPTIVLIALLVLLAVAHVMWFGERKRNPSIRTEYVGGVWDAFWWAFMAITTGGADRPERPLPRVFAMLWVLAGVIFLSSLTASITTWFTISQLSGDISSYRDLKGKRVGIAEGTSMERFAQANGIAYRPYDDLTKALAALRAGQIDATITDAPVAQYFALNDGAEFAALAGPVFAPEKLGIAFPDSSPLREPVNRALLEIFQDGTYAQIKLRYFGE